MSYLSVVFWSKGKRRRRESEREKVDFMRKTGTAVFMFLKVNHLAVSQRCDQHMLMSRCD